MGWGKERIWQLKLLSRVMYVACSSAWPCAYLGMLSPQDTATLLLVTLALP